MKLIIAEKPSVAQAIADAIGKCKKVNYGYENSEYTITSCFGHILKLADPDFYTSDDVPKSKSGKKVWRMEELPIIPSSWKKEASKDKYAKDRFFVIKDLLKKADLVIHAGDPDREGQLLVDEVLQLCAYKGKVLRYWSSAMDQTSVKRALNNLEDNSKFVSWGYSAEARSRLDWLLGMNMTRALTIKENELYSVGRVQSPVLKLIATRDAAIKDFKPTKHFNLNVTFVDSSSYQFNAVLEADDLKNAEGYILNKNTLQDIENQIKNQIGIILSQEKKRHVVTPELPYTLAELQSDCSKKFKLSPTKTLEIAQSLYEEFKLTTYPRSSCNYLPESQKKDVKQIISNICSYLPSFKNYLQLIDINRESKVWNDKKVSEEAHTAIIPTVTSQSNEIIKSLSEEQKKVFELICKKYFALFMPDHTYGTIKLKIRVKDYIFISNLKIVLKQGFKILFEKEEEENLYKNVPTFKENDQVKCIKTEVKDLITSPPPKFTEGSIILAMKSIAKFIDDEYEKKLLKESDGLGTEATRATILDTLISRNYISSSKSVLSCTETGYKLLSCIPEMFLSASFTAQTENRLKKIQSGQENVNSLLEDFKKILSEKVNLIKQSYTPKNLKENATCPCCGTTNFKRLKSKFKENSYYFFCFECKKSFFDNKGKVGDEIKKKK